MRELRKAAKEGPREFLTSFADLPHRHPFAIAGAIAAVVIIIIFAGVYEAYTNAGSAVKRVNVLRPQVTNVIRAASVCNEEVLDSERDSARCAARLRTALINCRRHPSCVQALNSALEGLAAPVPAPGQESASPGRSEGPVASLEEGGGAQTPSDKGHQKPGGDAPADQDQQQPPPARPSDPQVEKPPPAPATEDTAPPIDTCVNLVVEACVQVGT